MLDTMFATETMAELSARQGRLADAMAIYRHLIAGAHGDAARAEKWRTRLTELEAGGGGTAPAPTSEPAPKSANPTPPEIAEAPGPRSSLVVREPVRSGQVIYADGRDLIVVASVNPGAQVLADGNVHVYGALRGRAVAGAHGQRDTSVFCLALEAELIGVDTGYLLSDDLSAHWGATAMVSLRPDGTCVVMALPPARPVVPAPARRKLRA
jgi:septum site-determining protein MinC